jgi:exonuclease SbcD
MKFLHTSDWHLGKRLYKLERLDEQSYFLDWLIETLISEEIDHLLVAGDIFDVPQPPHRALKLFYDFIAQLMKKTKTELWIIGGNHDSASLLDAPTGLLDSKRIHLFGGLRDKPQEHWVKIPYQDSHIDLCLLPYFRQYELMKWSERISGENESENLIHQLITMPTQGVARFFMGHHLFGISEAAGSEQAISLSGMDSIPLSWFHDFAYVALGHIHKPQILSKKSPAVIYSGSPIPMRFSETKSKSVIIGEWSGELLYQERPIPQRRQFLSLPITASDWKESIRATKAQNLTLELRLTLKAPVTGLMDEIRNFCAQENIELLNIITEFEHAEVEDQKDHWSALLDLTPEELFEQFYLHKYSQEKSVPKDLMDDIKNLWQEASDAPPLA